MTTKKTQTFADPASLETKRRIQVRYLVQFQTVWKFSLKQLGKGVYNLHDHFQNNIGKCICLEQGGDKDEILKEYEPGHWWIEDKPENCEAGLKAGHNVIIMSHPYNEHYDNPLVFRVNSWSEIFELITKGEHDDITIHQYNRYCRF